MNFKKNKVLPCIAGVTLGRKKTMKKLFNTKNESSKDKAINASGIFFLLLLAILMVPALGRSLMVICPLAGKILAAIIVLAIVFGTISLVIKNVVFNKR